ncbi:FAD-binding oxidoreductase [Cognatishimia sp. MH4019]|uniref:NAD(P)/FAD-dependent oxidoreductase n=1 Tax=Cognatishimia sp. MH4019 TaxID=2854030 RepID=UPI001CD236FE|nr:FAD-binding oxidoreductase [Cognatishimia sp. MH4019]
MANSVSANDAPARIHWHRTATPAPVCDSLTGELTADFIVIGGGLTGTRTALGLAEEGASVVLLEAREIGYGASGRSGGQCNPIWRKTPDELSTLLGADVAARLVETTLGSADALFEDIARYGIECDAEQNGWVQAAHSGHARQTMSALAEAWIAAGADIRVLEGAQVQAATGSSAYDFALLHAKGGFVQPLSLTRGFARAALGFGAQLYESSPVRGIVRDGAGWRVSTDQGAVTAPQVILTTNGYTDDLWPGLRQTFYPMVSISLATAPLSDNLQKTVLPGAVTISDSRRAIYYARYDRDRRLIFGCIGSTETAATLGGVARLRRGLRRVFPQLGETPVEASWGGKIAVTPKMMPHLHEPAPGVLAGLGFSGRGIAMTSVMGRSLVRKALGAAEDTLPFAVSAMERVPLHWAATKLAPLAAPAASLRDRMDELLDKG